MLGFCRCLQIGRLYHNVSATFSFDWFFSLNHKDEVFVFFYYYTLVILDSFSFSPAVSSNLNSILYKGFFKSQPNSPVHCSNHNPAIILSWSCRDISTCGENSAGSINRGSRIIQAFLFESDPCHAFHLVTCFYSSPSLVELIMPRLRLFVCQFHWGGAQVPFVAVVVQLL